MQNESKCLTKWKRTKWRPNQEKWEYRSSIYSFIDSDSRVSHHIFTPLFGSSISQPGYYRYCHLPDAPPLEPSAQLVHAGWVSCATFTRTSDQCFHSPQDGWCFFFWCGLKYRMIRSRICLMSRILKLHWIWLLQNCCRFCGWPLQANLIVLPLALWFSSNSSNMHLGLFLVSDNCVGNLVSVEHGPEETTFWRAVKGWPPMASTIMSVCFFSSGPRNREHCILNLVVPNAYWFIQVRIPSIWWLQPNEIQFYA